ncbi:MAG: DEAD/DEAH box helicase [Clostridia bacterium]|jgi:ATP-dependent RNA helicase DeaD|nr:DEAD/DEAH box helicase [Clostridia bacterium]
MVSSSEFSSLGISPALEKSLKKLSINVPTEVQREVIPAVLEDKNLIVQSPTGTGKTLAYLLPLLQKLHVETKDLEVLVLVPSRELVFQVVQLVRMIAQDVSVASLSGGASRKRQLENLKVKPKIVVGTPGRVLDLFQKKKLNGQTIRTVVVDEVDKMMSEGFMGDVLSILRKTLKSRQVLFFSATIPREILHKAPELMEQPNFILLKGAGRIPEQIKHFYLMCERTKKFVTLERLLKIIQPKRALVFVTRPEGVVVIVEYLRKKGFSVVGLHSDLSQNERKNSIKSFREGKNLVLVTTDLLARGMDFAEVDYVFNFDLPVDAQHYLHRVGRTGRAGKTGAAITLVAENQKFILYKMARDLGVSLEKMGLDGERIFLIKNRRRK